MFEFYLKSKKQNIDVIIIYNGSKDNIFKKLKKLKVVVYIENTIPFKPNRI